MESIYAELALYGIKNKCAGTDNVFFLYAMVRFPLIHGEARAMNFRDLLLFIYLAAKMLNGLREKCRRENSSGKPDMK